MFFLVFLALMVTLDLFSAKNDYKIGYLTQDPDFDDNKTVLDTVLSSDLKEIQLIREYELIMLNYSEDKQAPLERVIGRDGFSPSLEIEARSRRFSASWVFRTYLLLLGNCQVV